MVRFHETETMESKCVVTGAVNWLCALEITRYLHDGTSKSHQSIVSVCSYTFHSLLPWSLCSVVADNLALPVSLLSKKKALHLVYYLVIWFVSKLAVPCKNREEKAVRDKAGLPFLWLFFLDHLGRKTPFPSHIIHGTRQSSHITKLVHPRPWHNCIRRWLGAGMISGRTWSNLIYYIIMGVIFLINCSFAWWYKVGGMFK